MIRGGLTRAMTAPTQPQRILIVGAGVVGQVLGAHAGTAGHAVTFVARRQQAARLSADGIRVVQGRRRSELQHRPDAVLDTIPTLNGYDRVFVCVRGEHREAVLADLARAGGTAQEIVLCFPLWSWQAQGADRHRRRVHLFLPGFSGLYRDGHIYVEHGRNRAAPLLNTPPEACGALVQWLSGVGLAAQHTPQLPRMMDAVLASGFPVLASLALHGYRLGPWRGDREAHRLAVAAQKDALALLRHQTGLHLLGRVAAAAPAPAVRALLRLVPTFAGQMGRDMLEVHFKKVHAQTVALLDELLMTDAARDYVAEDLRALLRRCAGGAGAVDSLRL